MHQEPPAHRRAATLEPLERRCLLAANFTFESGGDVIELVLDGPGDAVVSLDANGRAAVSLTGTTGASALSLETADDAELAGLQGDAGLGSLAAIGIDFGYLAFGGSAGEVRVGDIDPALATAPPTAAVNIDALGFGTFGRLLSGVRFEAGDVGYLRVVDFEAGAAVAVGDLQTFATTGDKTRGLAGDMRGAIEADNIGRMRVAGDLAGSVVTAGDVGTVSAGAFDRARIATGSAPASIFDAPSDFADGAFDASRIDRVTAWGVSSDLRPAFFGSTVAAGSIGDVLLGRVGRATAAREQAVVANSIDRVEIDGQAFENLSSERSVDLGNGLRFVRPGTGLADLRLDAAQVVGGANEQITFTAAIDFAGDDMSVALYESDADGDVGRKLGDLFDDGSPLNRDAAAGDGVFSNTFTLNEEAGTTRHFVARLEKGGAVETAAASLAFVAPLEEERLAQLRALSDSVGDVARDALDNGGTRGAAALAAARRLDEVGDEIEPGSVLVTSEGIAWRTRDGIEQAIAFAISQTAGDGGDGGILRSGGGGGGGGGTPFSGDPIEPPPAIGGDCGEALILSPFQWEFEPFDESNELRAMLETAGFDVAFLANASPGQEGDFISALRRLRGYDFISIASHGILTSGADVAFSTGQSAEIWAPAGSQNAADLQAGRLVQVNGDLGVAPSFITRYNAAALDGGVVSASFCQSLLNRSMADAFLSIGGDAYFGYSDNVRTDFASERGERLVAHLLAGGSVGATPGINVDSHPLDGGLASRFADVTGSLGGLFGGEAFAGGRTYWQLAARDESATLEPICRDGLADLELYVEYKWPETVKDLDTATTFLGDTAGFACGESGPYLDWSGDDTTVGGQEEIVVDLYGSYLDGAWDGSVAIDLAAGWYIPAGGSGPATLSVGLRDVATGAFVAFEQASVDPGEQSGCAEVNVGQVVVTLGGTAGAETVDFTLDA